jgi:hypothetical protein
MPYGSTLETAAARAAISKGDGIALERYLREGGNNPVQNITGATANLIPGTNLFNRAAGITATLPNAVGSQDVVRVVVQTLLTGSGIIKVARAADALAGNLIGATIAAAAPVAVAANQIGAQNTFSDTITMNGGTTGGGVGTVLTLTDIAPNVWLVEGHLNVVGTMITPFSAAV